MKSAGTTLLEVYFKDHQTFVSTFYLTDHSQSNLSIDATYFRPTEDCRKQATYERGNQLRLKHGTPNNGRYILLNSLFTTNFPYESVIQKLYN